MVRMAYSLAVAVSLTVLSFSDVARAQDGIWKALVPDAAAARGEFQNNDPVGLASGAEIKADCSLYWVDPSDQKMSCFSSGPSLETFLDAPQSYITQARNRWTKLHPAN
jgi:hypothetical protein